nr:immunoglobulin light chain junction region [Macaca mulatta]
DYYCYSGDDSGNYKLF